MYYQTNHKLRLHLQFFFPVNKQQTNAIYRNKGRNQYSCSAKSPTRQIKMSFAQYKPVYNQYLTSSVGKIMPCYPPCLILIAQNSFVAKSLFLGFALFLTFIAKERCLVITRIFFSLTSNCVFGTSFLSEIQDGSCYRDIHIQIGLGHFVCFIQIF